MDKQKQIGVFTFLLASVAGYCDTATFVAGGQVFSAHVTGNFIVFAAQLVLGNDEHAWIKLLAFPTFIIAVVIGGWIGEKSINRYFLLLLEGLLLLLCGSAWLIQANFYNNHTGIMLYGIVMVIVIAMGLQNAFGKLYAKETHGPTTMMTGNVTQLALNLGSLLRKGFGIEIFASFKKQLNLIGGFLTGCLLGVIISKQIGLAAVVVPAVVMIICSAAMREK